MLQSGTTSGEYPLCPSIGETIQQQATPQNSKDTLVNCSSPAGSYNDAVTDPADKCKPCPEGTTTKTRGGADDVNSDSDCSYTLPGYGAKNTDTPGKPEGLDLCPVGELLPHHSFMAFGKAACPRSIMSLACGVLLTGAGCCCCMGNMQSTCCLL